MTGPQLRCKHCTEPLSEEFWPPRCSNPTCVRFVRPPDNRGVVDGVQQHTPGLARREEKAAQVLEEGFGSAAPLVENTIVCSGCKRVPTCYICEPGVISFHSSPHPEPARAPGVKLDQGKAPIYTEFLMQFPRGIEEVARVGEQGTNAPGHVRSGWKEVERGHERYSNAMARHVLEEIKLLTLEHPEAGFVASVDELIFAAATVAWNAMARLEHLCKERGERVDAEPTP